MVLPPVKSCAQNDFWGDKMNILKILIIISSFLFQIFHVKAEILDGGEIRFNGFVTDEAPKWTWQVAAHDQTWRVDTANARIENKELVFNLRDKGSLPFLEGHLFEVAERGGPGFTPYITFNSNGKPFTILEGESSNSQHFRATVPVNNPDNNELIGQLAFDVDQGLAISVGRQESDVVLPPGMSLISGDSITNVNTQSLPKEVVSRLSALLMMNNKFGNGMNSSSNGHVINQGVLANGQITNIAAAYASSLSNFELRLPAENTPARWEASLNVTVTVH